MQLNLHINIVNCFLTSFNCLNLQVVHFIIYAEQTVRLRAGLSIPEAQGKLSIGGPHPSYLS